MDKKLYFTPGYSNLFYMKNSMTYAAFNDGSDMAITRLFDNSHPLHTNDIIYLYKRNLLKNNIAKYVKEWFIHECSTIPD